MIRTTILLAPDETEDELKSQISCLTGLRENDFAFEIRKKSLDARHGRVRYVYTVEIACVNSCDEEAAAAKCGGEAVGEEERYSFPKPQRITPLRPVVAGFGPAGIFASLMLARCGYRPIVLERGRRNEERQKDVAEFFGGGRLEPNSNIQFGEGGAGAFSDGKLNTLVKDKGFRGYFVLCELVKAGAPAEILYDAKPHIGTDLLRGIISNIRNEIITLGGEIRFETTLDDIEETGGKLTSVTANGLRINADTLFIATGQSSRGVYEMLMNRGAELERKPFSVGFRIEHPQSMVNRAQYGENDFNRFLPPADYKLSQKCLDGRIVYSFCMCPGGSVVAAASEAERLVTNGMSFHARDGENANSAILCEVLRENLGDGLLAGFDFREKLERNAFTLGGGEFTAPCQTVGSFLGTDNSGVASVRPTYPRGVRHTDISSLFPESMNACFREAIFAFGKKIKGFDFTGALITAVESRTSSPVRIKRDLNGMSSIAGIYPVGEGAGYAGGIISAAIDGIKAAERFVSE